MVQTSISQDDAQRLFALCTEEQQTAIRSAGGRVAKAKACPENWTLAMKVGVADYVLGLELETINKRMFSAFGDGVKTQHSKDSDCTVDPRTCLCVVCGVECGEPCPDCGCQSFHAEGCTLSGVPMPIDSEPPNQVN